MTDGLTNFFNLPPLDQVLKEKGIDVHAQVAKPQREPENKTVPEPSEQDDSVDSSEMETTIANMRGISARMSMLEGTDHAEAMDSLYDEIVGHARDLMAFGFNTDQKGARGIFEIASLMYGHAISAKNHKRDAQLKAMKLALERRKVELDEKRTNHSIGDNQAAVMENGNIIVEDRNEMIKRLREQMKKET